MRTGSASSLPQPLRCPWALLLLTTAALHAQTPWITYDDTLQNGWADWSWAEVSLTSPSPAHAGTAAIGVTAGAWEALYLHHAAFPAATYTNLTFWAHGGSAGGQRLQLQATLSGNPQTAVSLPTLTANTWQQITVALQALGVDGANDLDGFWIQDRSGTAQPQFFIDDIAWIPGAAVPPTTNTAVVLTVDAQRNRRPINPLIYGVAFASADQLNALNTPLNRSGGNSETRYNWQLNAHNRGADWYFQSLPDASATPGAEGDAFVQASRSAGAEPMLTVPIIGWAPKLGANRGRLASYSIAKYGAQTDRDSAWFPDAGNGIRASDGVAITWNDPHDANQPVDAAFQQGWIRHLTNRWGLSSAGGVQYYLMDNEISLWHATHRDIHPVGATLQEVRDRFLEYAATVKDVDPAARIGGPEEWGWSGYFYSGFDQQWGSTHGWSNFPDRSTNGGWEYLPWFLDQIRRHDATAGRRHLDLFTVHFYPQGGEFSSTTSTAMQSRRNRSTRALWDPAYRDETWIDDTVRLIPRLRDWTAAHYPNTPIGITEYSWGADAHINGATAQADLLGIFGREGLDVATRWVVPDTGTPVFRAFQIYRNYDGQRSTFGETSVYAGGSNPDHVAAFAATRSTDGALTVVVINKDPAVAPLSLQWTNYIAGLNAQAWQLTAANSITRLADIPLPGATLTNTLPAQSITLFVIPAGLALPPRLHLAPSATHGVFSLTVAGTEGQRCVIEAATTFGAWSPLVTNTLSTAAPPVSITASGAQRWFRARN